MINHQIIKSLGQHNNECGYCVATLPMHQENQNANTYAAILAAMHKYELPTMKIAENKQYHMASYLIKLFYDLAIGSANNISEAPGFEVPLGAWIKD